MKKLLGALLGAFFIFSQPANALYVINDDPGGVVEYFQLRYEILRASNDKVMIDGVCASACTLVTGIVKPYNVCVTPNARLGFHSAWMRQTPYSPPEFSPEGTQQVWKTYPKQVQEMLKSRGWDGSTEHPDIIWVQGEDLRKLYSACAEENDNLINHFWIAAVSVIVAVGAAIMLALAGSKEK